ncbi:hypothetical protein KRP22_012205 [Phytophthora ramorum]|nr:Counting factor 60 [Phytophthora ramorum]
MATSSTSRDLALRHVLIFHRHGDRTPVLTSIGTKVQATQEEKDFWASKVATTEQLELLELTAKPVGAEATQPPVIRPSKESQFPYGLLTQKGVEHMTGKGRALKERYGTLLDDNVQVDDIYVLSSSVPRTIESVQCLLRGFFEQQKAPQFYVHTYARNVLAPMHPLQVFNEIELIVHDDVLQLRSKIEREAMDKLGLHLRECLGVPDDQPLSWTAVRDALTCREAHGWPFPEGVDHKIFEQSDSKRQNSLSTYKSRSSFGSDGKMPSRRNRRTWRNNRQSRSTRKQPLSAAVSGDSS